MDLRRLRTFVIIAEQGTVSSAALVLHISQPGLSRQIGELQQELGLKLFDRIGRRLVLTAEGEQLLADCRYLLDYADAISERAQVLRGGDTGILKVAASPLQFETVFSTLLHRYAQRYPNVHVKLIEAVGLDTLAMLERGEIHFGVCLLQSIKTDDSRFGHSQMRPIELLGACQPSLRLGRGSKIDVVRLASYSLLLPDSSFAVRKTFDAVCNLARLKPDILIESRAPHTLLAFAEAGHGVAVIPSGLRTHRYTLRSVRITYKGEPLREELAVVWGKRRVLPGYATEFSKLLAAHTRGASPSPIGQPKR
jgi:DNA-binding transcriptional LysR family regulator